MTLKAAPFTVFRRIIFPLTLPGVVIGQVLVFLNVMSDFATVATIGGNKHALLSNLVLLCRRHHRSVHEEGFTVERLADGVSQFRQPQGWVIPEVSETPRWPRMRERRYDVKPRARAFT